MAKFRIPRKVKKNLKKDMWFYPMDEKTKTYEIIFPCDSQENYDVWKRKEVNSFRESVKRLKKENNHE